MLCGHPGLVLYCGDFTCVLNDTFNVVLYTNHTVVHGNTAQPLGFIVPVHYLSFIKTIDRAHDLSTKPSDIFRFEKPSDAAALSAYIARLGGDGKFAILTGLLPPKSSSIPNKYWMNKSAI